MQYFPHRRIQWLSFVLHRLLYHAQFWQTAAQLPYITMKKNGANLVSRVTHLKKLLYEEIVHNIGERKRYRQLHTASNLHTFLWFMLLEYFFFQQAYLLDKELIYKEFSMKFVILNESLWPLFWTFYLYKCTLHFYIEFNHLDLLK